MKQRAFLVLSIILTLILAGSGTLLAKEIKVLTQFPLSGPHGTLPEVGWGYIDYMNWVNTEGGGVGGKKITYFLEDMRYNPTVEVATFNKYAAEHSKDELLMATGFITGGLKPLIEKVNKEEKIPWLDGSYSSEIFGKEGGPSKYPYYYSLGATYGHQNMMCMKWIKENHKGPGKPRVGYVYSPTGWGRDGPPEGKAYAKKLGIDIVAEIEFPYTATDATNECMQLRKKKAQYVIYHGYSMTQSATIIFFKTAKKVIPKIQIMGTHYTSSYPVFGPLLAGPAFDGYIGIACSPVFDAVPRSATPMDNKVVKFAHDFAKKYRPEAYKKGMQGGIRSMSLYYGGLIYAVFIHEALTRAHKSGDLTRLGVKKALDNMVWDFRGAFGGKTFAYKSHTVPMLRVYRGKVKMVKMGDKMVPTGGLEPISDWINTDEVKW
jgi:ABC-type branched-subunit amino acid transport system substrate-binding protein